MSDAREDSENDGDTPQPPPGPADHGGQGGMATREKAPELAHVDESKD